MWSSSLRRMHKRVSSLPKKTESCQHEALSGHSQSYDIWDPDWNAEHYCFGGRALSWRDRSSGGLREPEQATFAASTAALGQAIAHVTNSGFA